MAPELDHGPAPDDLVRLVRSAAHDLNNLLTAILGHAGLCAIALDAASPVQPLLRAIEDAAQQAAGNTRALLAAARAAGPARATAAD